MGIAKELVVEPFRSRPPILVESGGSDAAPEMSGAAECNIGLRAVELALHYTCTHLAFGLSMKELAVGMSPPASEPKDGPLDML